MKTTYLVFFNKTRRPIKAGQQVFFSYGNVTNRYLMQERDFCLDNNKYDSLHFHVRMDIKLDKKIQAEDMIAPVEQKNNL